MAAKILVVDDEPHLEIVILQVFRREIRNQDLSFLFAHNGRHALEVLEEEPSIDMVISDINMPEMGGLALLKALNESFPLLKTVIVTAYGDMANIRAAMNHGAFDFLNKPINFKDLKITIKKTLGHVKQLKDLHRERQQRYLAEKLKALTEHMTTTLDLSEVLDRFLKNLGEVMAYKKAFIGLAGENDIQVVAAIGFGSLTDQDAQRSIKNVYEIVAEEQSVLTLQEMGDRLDRRFTSSLGGSSLESMVCAPLVSKSGIPGMAVLDVGENKGPETHEREAIQSLCANAAFAIENARLFEEVRRLATMDSLTGLYNRRHFLEQSEKEVTRSLRYGNPLCALMVDIDNFKTFNDTYGHAVGDRVLKQVADTLTHECRQTDFLGRFGGDEMVILLIETDMALGEEIAERLRQAVEEQSFEVESHGSVPITISMGMASISPDTENLASLLNHADQRLYAAKQRGRNCVVAS